MFSKTCSVEDRRAGFMYGSAEQTCGDDEGLAGGVDVGLRPWQHPHARQLKERIANWLVFGKIQGRYAIRMAR
jgi:hypothetical protein